MDATCSPMQHRLRFLGAFVTKIQENLIFNNWLTILNFFLERMCLVLRLLSMQAHQLLFCKTDKVQLWRRMSMFPHTPVVTWPPKMGLSLYFCLSSEQVSERVIAIQSRPPHGVEHQVSYHPQLSILGDPVLSFPLSTRYCNCSIPILLC